MKNIIGGLSLLLFVSCGQGNENVTEKKDTTTTKVSEPALRPENIPLDRANIKKEPVAEYRVRTENPLNEWYFQVQLFETPKTFHYLIRLEYEVIQGKDTLKLPNFGTMPRPVIQEGPDKYSCIIGFLDKDDKFREYKKVYVKGNTLRIEAIKHYGVKG